MRNAELGIVGDVVSLYERRVCGERWGERGERR